jgi:hypothetical protein
MLTNILLALVYPLLLLARLINVVTGRDPLRSHRPTDASLWIARDIVSTDASYFSEASPAEVRRRVSLPASLLAWIARLYAPPRSQPEGKFSAGADREQGIPDEMYTLW